MELKEIYKPKPPSEKAMTGVPVYLPDEFVLCSAYDGCYGLLIFILVW